MLTFVARPDVRFFCDLNFDPFLLMQDQNKVYGFTISLYEYEATIPSLWSAVRGKGGADEWGISRPRDLKNFTLLDRVHRGESGTGVTR